MSDIFISGSRSIKNLPSMVTATINDFIQKRYGFLVGDCYGADTIVQQHLHNKGYSDVSVFHVGREPRNYLDPQWFPCKVLVNSTDSPRTRQTRKDIVMSEVCDEGLVVWDGTSPGTFNNIERMISLDKQVIVFVKDAMFTIQTTNELNRLKKYIKPAFKI